MTLDTTVPAALFTNGHILVCRISTRGNRLLDLLNNSSSEFLQLEDVQTYRVTCRSHVASFPDGVIRKSRLLLAILTDNRCKDSTRRNYAQTVKDQYAGFITIGDLEIRGKLHLGRHPDVATFLLHATGNFFPVTEANVSCVDNEDEESKPVVLINKNFVDFIQISPDKPRSDDLLLAIHGLINE